MVHPADRAIGKMRSPKDMCIICVDVTNRCDLNCSNCTRLLSNQHQFWDMTADNFRAALRSLRGFKGVIAMIGGNPCMHKGFSDLCKIFIEEVPAKHQRGLWSNNIFKYQETIRDCFGFFNLNPHNDRRGIESFKKLQQLMPGIPYYQGNSLHAPLLTAVRDLFPDEREMWGQIENCDINREWSASIVQNRGQLRAYFCEVAAAFDLARNQDHGVPVVEGWWEKSIADYAAQVRHFCPGCGVPARLQGHLDCDEVDSYSPSNADIAAFTKKRHARKLVEIRGLDEATRLDRHVTDYNEYCVRPDPAPPQPDRTEGTLVSVVIPCFNANHTIRGTVLSALRQDGTDVEVIVVDDCSTDGPQRVLEGLPGNIRIVKNDRNIGPGASRNVGLKLARGKYICFLDSDDEYVSGFFSEAVTYLNAHADVQSVTSGVELIDCDRHVNQYYHMATVTSVPSNLMVRTAVARIVGGFPEDAAFRGEAAGEDVCFKQALSQFVSHHLAFPFLRYRVWKGSHFERFLDGTEIKSGRIVMTSASKEELDGSLAASSERYHLEVQKRIEAEILAQARGYAVSYASFWLDEAYQTLGRRFADTEGQLDPEEGYALYLWASRGPGQGDVVEIGRLMSRATCWLAAGCCDSRRGTVFVGDNFYRNARSTMTSTFLMDPFINEEGAYHKMLDTIKSHDLSEFVEIFRGDHYLVADNWTRPIRLLFINGEQSDDVLRNDVDSWLRHVENVGAVAFSGIGVNAGVTRFYSEFLQSNNAVREIFAVRSLRIIGAR